MISYPSYDALAIDLDLHFFDKAKVLNQAGKRLENGGWFVITDDGHCHLVDENGNLDDINKITTIFSNYIRKDIKKIIIPDSVTNIWEAAFYGCRALINVTIPNSVTSIKNDTFYGCSSLASVLIPNSVTRIGWSTFYSCSCLTSVTIGNGVTNIGDWAFEYCSSLANVMIPNAVTDIGWDAFEGCENLTSVFFKGKTLKQVRAMERYPWGIEDESIIKVS